ACVLSDAASGCRDARPDRSTVNMLAAQHRCLAGAFAGRAPAPGGVFRLGEWTDSSWGPVLQGSSGWFGVERDSSASEPDQYLGWALAVTGVIAEIHLSDVDGLIHQRGRYRT